MKYERSNSKITDDEDEEDEKIKTSLPNLETYVKIRFYRSNKNSIFVAPKNITLVEGQKVKVQVDENTVKTAVVTKANYTREKYKSYEYQTLKIAEK